DLAAIARLAVPIHEARLARPNLTRPRAAPTPAIGDITRPGLCITIAAALGTAAAAVQRVHGELCLAAIRILFVALADPHVAPLDRTLTRITSRRTIGDHAKVATGAAVRED